MAFVEQPHKCTCFGNYCWKNLCPERSKSRMQPESPSEVLPADSLRIRIRRRIKTEAEQSRAYSAKPNDPNILVWRPDEQ